MKPNYKRLMSLLIGKKRFHSLVLFKNKVGFLYNSFIFKTKVKNKKLVSEFEKKVTYVFSVNNCNLFCGYYDKTPFNHDDTKMLAICAPNYVSAYNNTKCNICLIDLQSHDFKRISETETWNWQQGCRLMWHPLEKDKIMYNNIVEGEYGCEIYDINKGQVIAKIKFPYYDITNDGRYLISLNFSRLQRLRKGYGYSNLPDYTVEEKCPGMDGIWIYDIVNGSKKLVVTLELLAHCEPHESMKHAHHYVNHISANPFDENTFLFFHLWKNNKTMRSRAFLYNILTERLTFITNEEFVSHYAWKTKNELLIFSEDENHHHNYFLYDLIDGSKKTIGDETLNEDGHPSFFKYEDWLLTDTYPNNECVQKLMIYDLHGKKLLLDTHVPSYPVEHNDFRCDLHPRISNSERLVCFDSNFHKRRSIVILDIKKHL